MRKRAAAAIVSASALTLLVATSALAGGWANAVMDEAPNQPGGPSQPVTIGFTLLQHGVTPVDWGTTQVVLTNDATGQSVTFDARPQGADGPLGRRDQRPGRGNVELPGAPRAGDFHVWLPADHGR